jgi:hypothetical protein
MRKLSFLLLMAAFLGIANYASADSIVFSDNFNTENGGVGTLNYYGFANWTVTAGSVDLIGNGNFDFLPGNGLYVDLDGSTNQAGTMVSAPLNLAAGTYDFQFDLAGSQRGPTEPVTASVSSGLASQVYSFPSDQGFTLESMPFVLNSPQTLTLSFSEVGTSNMGMLLDNVSLTQITQETAAAPLPSTLAGGLILMSGLMVMRIHRRRLA